MKFQDDISNMNTYIHTDKPKPICPHFFKVGGITSLMPYASNKSCTSQLVWSIVVLPVWKHLKTHFNQNHKSGVMRKPTFCICENKDTDQLRGNREAD